MTQQQREPLREDNPIIIKHICDCCGEWHPFMEDNKDGSFTCLPCINKQDDSNDIDNSMGCS